MLKIIFYKNFMLGTERVEVFGKNAMEILSKYFKNSVLKEKTFKEQITMAYIILGFPTGKLLHCKQLHNAAVLLQDLIRAKKAKWLKYDEAAIDPKNALRTIRGNRHPTDEHRQAISERKKAQFASMTPEQKAERSAKLKAGWANREKMPMSLQEYERRKRAQKARFASMTPEQKAERSAALKAGWAARRERIEAEKLKNANDNT